MQSPEAEGAKELGPIVTNDEIEARVKVANKQFLQFSDFPENHVILTGSGIELLGRMAFPGIRPVDDPTGENVHTLDSGKLMLRPHNFLTDKDTAMLFEDSDLSKKFQNLSTFLVTKGIHLIYCLDKQDPQMNTNEKGSFGIGQMSIHLGFEPLDSSSDNQSDISSVIGVVTFYQEAKSRSATVISINHLQKNISMKILPTGEKEERVFYYDPIIDMDIPYSKHRDITQSTIFLTEVIKGMDEKGIISLDIDPTIEFRFSKPIKSTESKERPALEKKEYDKRIAELSKTDSEIESGDLFVRQFFEDLKRVEFLSFTDSVRHTRLLTPTLLTKDLIVRNEICEVAQTKEDNWVILLPAGLFIPPEEDYRNIYMHSRIRETWEDSSAEYSSRRSLVEELKPIEEFVQLDKIPVGYGYRSYFIEFASGKKTIIIGANKVEAEKIMAELKKKLDIEDLDVLFPDEDLLEKITYERQVNASINQNT